MPATNASTRRLVLQPPRLDGLGRRLPPGPRTFPVVGGGLGLATNFLPTLTSYRRRYGDVVHVPLALAEVYVYNHPDDIQSILVGEHSHLMKDELTRVLSRYVGDGLLTSEGTVWRRQRKIAAPSFQRRHIESFGEAMVRRSQQRLAGIPPYSQRDVHVDMMRITLEIVLDTMFGADTVRDIDTVGEIVDDMLIGFRRQYLTFRRLLPDSLRARALAELDRHVERLDVILYDLIAEGRKAKGDTNLLSRLLDARDDDDQGMTDQQVRDEVATVFLAGHETTALALSYTLHLLAHHPDVARRVQEEVDRVLGKRPARVDDVPALVLTDAVLRESMRLYPPAYTVGRELLADREIGGYEVPKGCQVLTPQWVVHRDPRWYTEPDSFRPDRWLEGRSQGLHRFAYFPFGGGPRICVGNHFAMLEGVLVLATMIQQLEVKPMAKAPPLRLSNAVTLRPAKGVWLEVQRRD